MFSDGQITAAPHSDAGLLASRMVLELVEQRLSDTNTWADQNCAETRPFICQDGELFLCQILIKLTMKRKQQQNCVPYCDKYPNILEKEQGAGFGSVHQLLIGC